jgi:hypothetical protein
MAVNLPHKERYPAEACKTGKEILIRAMFTPDRRNRKIRLTLFGA